MGLSPRARGSLARALPPTVGSGSIPAGAGKPPLHLTHRYRRRVYPRGRGEAPAPQTFRYPPKGLSPRARGSHRPGVHPGRVSGSIPAGAGKPSARRPFRAGLRVYPRGRGEATVATVVPAMTMGLSPRARGSHAVAAPSVPDVGSIPAGAGKPDRRRMPRRARGVYPRGRGEALRSSFFCPPCMGLSPRARGSPYGPARARLWSGSIPAGAGKP